MRFLSHRVSRNAIALGLIQLSNYAIPLILLPYLTRVLGLNLYGIVAFGLSIVQLSLVITDFGFNLSATELISIHRDNKKYVEQTLSAIYIIKTGLFILITLIIFIYSIFTSKYEAFRLFIIFNLFAILGQSFQPIWFFQGIEKMKFVTIYTITARLIYFCSILLYVNSSKDILLVPLFNGVAQISAAMLAIFLIYKLQFKFRQPSISFIVSIIKQSTQYFLSRISVAMYTSGNAFFLGIFGTIDQVAIYSLAEQIYRGLQGFYMPINSALYPYMAKEKNYALFFRIVTSIFIICILCSIIGYFVCDHLLILLFGAEFIGSSLIVKYFLIILPINIVAVFFGYGFLSSFGKTQIANISVIAGSILHIIGLFVVGLILGLNAQIITLIVILTESFVCITRLKFSYIEYKKYIPSGLDNDEVI